VAKNDFVTELQALVNRPGQMRPASTITRNMDVAAVISKFVMPRDNSRQSMMTEESENMTTNTGVDQISKAIIARIEDNENIIRLFPDIELAIQILVSSIISPKDMIKSELIFRTKDINLPPQLVSALLDIVKGELEDTYNLKKELPTIIRDALFNKGSHVKAVIPESAVDELINRQTRITTESMYSPDIFMPTITGREKGTVAHLGLLGNPKETVPVGGINRLMALESAMAVTSDTTYDGALYIGNYKPTSETIEVEVFSALIQEHIEISDNFHVLKLPKLLEAANAQKADELLGRDLRKYARTFATEAYHMFKVEDKPTPKELSGMLYKTNDPTYTPFKVLPASMNLKRRSVGRPLLLNIPSEAAIPIHVPGSPNEHIGYFFPTDSDGNFVTVASATNDSGQGLASMLQADRAGTSSAALLTEKARKNISGDGMVPQIEHMTELYADIIENDMLTRLAKGIYGKKLNVGRNNEIYRIMMTRALQGQFTRLVYIPAEYVTYFAFNFHRNGVGKSYLDDMANITSMRAMVIFSKVMAAVKSSISTTHVSVELDPRDHDPVKTMETAKHLVAKTRQQYFPHGLNRVADLTDWIQRAGIELTFSGHPRLPTTKFEFESKNIQHVMPDDGLEELFRHQTYMHFGLSPEMVDNASNADFATTVENNSILFSRRILTHSDKFSHDASDFARKVCTHDQTIQEKFVGVLKDHTAELQSRMSDDEKAMFEKDSAGFTAYVIEMFIEAIEVDLPKPDTTRVENQKTSFTAYEDQIEKALAYIFSSDVLPKEVGGEANQYIDALRSAWKADRMRKWMSENNYTPEIFDIVNTDSDGKPMANLLTTTTDFSKNLLLNIDSYLKMMKSAKDASDKDLTTMGAGESSGGEAPDTSGGNSSGDGDNYGGSDEFGSGGDEFGGDGGSPFDEIPGGGDDLTPGEGEAAGEGGPGEPAGPDEPKANEEPASGADLQKESKF